MNQRLGVLIVLAMVTVGLQARAADVPADNDPIGHGRLVRAHAYATNAKTLCEGGAAQSHKQLVEAARKLDDRKLRLEIGMMVDVVPLKVMTIQVASVQNNVIANVRMVRAQLLNEKVSTSLDEICDNVRRQRKKNPKFSPTEDVRDQVQAIRGALRSQ